MSIKRSELVNAAKELNVILGLKPSIDIKGTAPELQDALLQALTLINKEEDEFTKETQAILDELAKRDGIITEKVEKPKKEKVEKPKVAGVIETIGRSIENSGQEGITKEAILKILTKQFPGRSPEGMKATINTQVPNRITKERFPVERLENGAYRKVI